MQLFLIHKINQEATVHFLVLNILFLMQILTALVKIFLITYSIFLYNFR